MPEYLAPGVYIEEVDSGSRAIEGVSTSTAGFVGETERGPTRTTLVTSWTDYVRRYGGFIDQPPFSRAHHFLPYGVRGFFENGGKRLVIARVTARSAQTAAVTLVGEPGAVQLRALGPGSWGNNVQVSVKAAASGDRRFGIDIRYSDALETFDNLSADPAQPEFAPTIVNRASELIEIAECSGTPPSIDCIALVGGTDAPSLLEDYVGDRSTDHPTGLMALAAIKGVSIVAAPDAVLVDGLAQALLDTCETSRDRFAVISAPHPIADVGSIVPVRDTSWGAVYYPWLHVEASHIPARTKAVPCTGHICGVYARVDIERGAHKPPANEVLRGLAAAGPGTTSLSHLVTQAEQEILNPRGVNLIREFAGRGVRVWGARTMSSDAEWKYISIRRFCIYLEQSIDRGLEWVVFEPNTEPLWVAVRQAVENFLTGQWRDGALLGSKPEHAFYVRCDRGTMTQDDIDNGRLILEIGIALIRPAEFVLLRFTVKTEPGRP
jgi:uncharacterized protein